MARRKSADAQTSFGDPPQRETPKPPDWFAMPTTSVTRPHQSLFSGDRRELVYRVIDQMRSGELALAPWQRPSVWTEGQRIHLLDSMMRGISVGAVTLWQPPAGDGSGRPFPGCEIQPDAVLVADGQQRLTTLRMAAIGDLDHWRWDGAEWTEGPGFLTPSMAVRGATGDHLDWFDWLRGLDSARSVINQCVRDLEAIARTDMHLMVLDGPAEHMIETYRRLATCGSPHSTEDLAVMEAWFAAQGDD